MTSQEMVREFKIGTDKIDSESYPEIYEGQIYMFINKAISEIVNEGRKVFEKTQTITDNLKALIPARPINIVANKVIGTNDYTFDLSTAGVNYLFYIRSSINTQVGLLIGRAEAKVVQQDDIEIVLNDPYNNPKPYRVPITFSRNTITGYANSTFIINSIDLVYVKQPAIVSSGINCDLDSQIHYTIVDRAIEIAYESLGLIKNTQEIQE